ncbi:MAG: hypothetical protein COU31_04930 [Candidatus Magasanikbacteria bacterium CG10_big_fil_rev_8_21_14_0_10_40_10]|uniref:Uncharacterized protein n=1 Tax=Candidatus Magasanikbacteria bacterium CG10_big_fil_rev_8_21_14_0_10_40_10 TaxID=1974648 RepID=A0A2M6W2S0_9BACT|nr:MAG: hypothetical protein COU31_04930 [Candidatus Magasanikbacteria bacterium CG10_big_fil_rev_8_21_14_0_10_40_10]
MYYIFTKIAVILARLKKVLPQTKKGRIVLVCLVAVMMVGLAGRTDATVVEIAKNAFLDLLSWIILILASLFMKIAIWLLSFVIELGAYNGYIDSSAVTVGWVMVRDVANMFFVVILLLIAFGTILGLEQYEWKKMMMKLMLAALLVNFSRVICGLMIDVSQVIMITFINGISATAGGNFIQMFSLDKIQTLSATGTDLDVSDGNVFMASVAGLVFAAMAMFSIAIYVIILLARMIVLWVLIVLSPLAFVLSVIPQTQSYASQWWKEFGGHVVVGPLLAFFLWLSFVSLTANSNGINAEIGQGNPAAIKVSEGAGSVGKYDAGSAGISKAMTWHNMANFAIAIGMLMVGAKAAQATGATAGGMMSGAIDFGKKVGTIASGVATGMWLYKGAGKLAGGAAKGVGKGAMMLTGIDDRIELIKNRAKTEYGSYKAWRSGLLTRKAKSQVWMEDANGQNGDWVNEEEVEAKKKSGFREKMEEVNPGVWMPKTQARMYEGEHYKDSKGRFIDDKGFVLDENFKRMKDKKGNDVPLSIDKAEVAKEIDDAKKRGKEQVKAVMMEDQSEYDKRTGGFFAKAVKKGLLFGGGHERLIASRKKLSKTENYGKNIEELAKNQTGGIPAGYFQDKHWFDGEDRFTEGLLNKEKERSQAKTHDFGSLGEMSTASTSRFKNGKYENLSGSMAARIVKHEAKAEAVKENMKVLTEQAKNNFNKGAGKNVLMAKIAADIKVKAAQEEGKKIIAKQEVLAEKVGEQLTKEDLEFLRRVPKVETEKEKEKREGLLLAHQVAEASKRKVFETQRAKVAEEEKKAIDKEHELEFYGKDEGKQLLKDLNRFEQAIKQVDDFIKESKSADLQKQMESAKKILDEVLLGQKKEDIEGIITKLRAGENLNMPDKISAEIEPYIRALAAGQLVKVQEETTKLRQEQATDSALDAFVYKPRYGTTSPASAQTNYMKTKLDDFRQLERVKAMKQATDIMAFLRKEKASGKTLSADQTALLAAAGSFLTEESWVDDMGQYIDEMMNKLSNGDLEGDELETWKEMAVMFQEIGWIKSKKEGVELTPNNMFSVGADGKTRLDTKVVDTETVGKYERKQAADLQALTLSGLDTEMLQAHHAVSEELTKRGKDAKTKMNKSEEGIIKEAMETDEGKAVADKARVGITSRENKKRKENVEKRRKDAIAKAKKEASEQGLEGDSVKNFVEEKTKKFDEGIATEEAKIKQNIEKLAEDAARTAVQGLDSVQIKIAEASKKIKNEAQADYWKVADQILGKFQFKGEREGTEAENIKDAKTFKDRYGKYADIFQFGTRTFKKNSLDNGHPETAMNMDYDEFGDTYRLQTEGEAEAKIHADRVKIGRRKLLNGDQYHAYGALDYDTMVVDDLLENVLRVTLGKVAKLIEMADVPERSLKGYFYVHKNEDARKEDVREKDGEYREYAVVGSRSANQKFENEGDITAEQKEKHILARGMLKHLMSGPGYRLGLAKLFGHIDEREANSGQIRVKIGDSHYKTDADLANRILELVESKDEEFIKHLAKTDYASDLDRVKKVLNQIKSGSGFVASADDNGDDLEEEVQ